MTHTSGLSRAARLVRAGLVGAAALALTAVLSSCSLSGAVYNAPLPGGADVGSDPITLTADFKDVLDLVPQSAVKIDDVAVGRVSRITLNPDGHSAHVTLVINRDADPPVGTTARLDQTSLLGEKYVALQPPRVETVAAPRLLSSGAHIRLADTSEAVQVEQLFGALSMVLNGGDIGQFQEISRELQALGSNPTQIRSFLTEMDHFVSTMADRKSAITDALDGLDRLGSELHQNEGKIATALDDLSPGMKVLADQRPQLVKMLKALDRLSGVTVSTLNASKRNIVKDLRLLDPILQQLADAGSALPDSLQILLTYPFPDAVLGAIKGDYFNAFVTTNFRTVPTNCAEEGCAWPQPVVGRRSAGGPSPGSTSGAPSTKAEPFSLSPPTLLPPTDTPVPGYPSSTIPVAPDTTQPGGSPTGSGGSGSGSPTSPGAPSSSAGSTPSATRSGDGASATPDPSGSPGSSSTPTDNSAEGE